MSEAYAYAVDAFKKITNQITRLARNIQLLSVNPSLPVHVLKKDRQVGIKKLN